MNCDILMQSLLAAGALHKTANTAIFAINLIELVKLAAQQHFTNYKKKQKDNKKTHYN